MSELRPLTEADRILLEDYVLGALAPAEAAQMEQKLRENLALQQELAALQSTLRLMPLGLTAEDPPPELRDRILSANAERNRILAPSAELPPPQSTSQPIAPPPLGSRASTGRRWLTVLALAAIALLAVDNWRLRRAFQLAQQQTPEAIAGILQQPNSRLVALQESANGDASGTLLFTPGQWQQVIVSLGDLPPLPPDEVYRMWLSLENGQTIFCGEFNTDALGNVFIELRPAEAVPEGVKATGVFVTVDTKTAPLEPSGEKVLTGTI